MTTDRLGITTDGKLVRKADPASLNLGTLPKRQTKKRARAPARLKEKVIKGKKYYYWHREGRKEVYLGDADRILEAVRSSKGISREIKGDR